VGSVLKNPAGLENAKGILSTNYLKEPPPTRPWKDDPAIKEWARLHGQVFPGGRQDEHVQRLRLSDRAKTMVQVLKQCGDELTRENVMRAGSQPQEFRTRIAATRAL